MPSDTPRHVVARAAELAAAGGERPDAPMAERLRTAILALARHRGAGSSICPSDAARAVGGSDWRDLLPDTREKARELARQGHVLITSRGAELSPDEDWHGPIRIRTTD